MISEGRARALEPEHEEQPSEFGVTLADAGRLLKKAKLCWIMFKVGNLEKTAIFAIPKSSVLREIRLYQGGKNTIRPSELDCNVSDGPILIFGSQEAIDRAEIALAAQSKSPPRRCDTNIVQHDGSCMACNADQGVACLAKAGAT
jgi:hypothetical protein